MMTRSWMDALSPPAAYFPNSNWLIDPRKCGFWTEDENKRFENALASVDQNSPDRWVKVAGMIPGKSADDVLSHYQDLEEDVNHIEAGLIPFPGYSSSFMLDWETGQGLKQAYCVGGGKRSGARPSDQERKKGVPWTEEEHRQFLTGLAKYGKGDWRNISRNHVFSRTPTQVASHAQKYFIRLNSGSKDKRRSSIHDITTINISDTRPSPPSQQPSGIPMQSTSVAAPRTSDQFSAVVVDSNQHHEAASVLTHGNPFIQRPYGIDSSYRMKTQAHQHMHGGTHNSIVGPHSMLYHMQTVQPHPHG